MVVIPLPAADLKPETAAAFDNYIQRFQAELEARSTPDNYLWLDQHRQQKTLVWMQQRIIELRQSGGEKAGPDGVIQHWFGAIYLETATLERARDMLLSYADYKVFFKPQVLDSKLLKRDGNRFDATLRLQKRQVTQVVLNAEMTADFAALDAKHVSISSRSTRIAEMKHAGKADSTRQELPPEDQNGYLWRWNIYWRLVQSDVGVYAEADLITLSRASGAMHPGRLLTGFQTFPREMTEAFFDGLTRAFPPLRK